VEVGNNGAFFFLSLRLLSVAAFYLLLLPVENCCLRKAVSVVCLSVLNRL
jgi:hypothetical protein